MYAAFQSGGLLTSPPIYLERRQSLGQLYVWSLYHICSQGMHRAVFTNSYAKAKIPENEADQKKTSLHRKDEQILHVYHEQTSRLMINLVLTIFRLLLLNKIYFSSVIQTN